MTADAMGADATGADGQLSLPAAQKAPGDAKLKMANSILDAATLIVEHIWPPTIPPPRPREDAASSSGVIQDAASSGVIQDAIPSGIIPLRSFIKDVLHRARASYYSLSLALYYVVLLHTHLKRHQDGAPQGALRCGRRMFLAAMVVASKNLNDYDFHFGLWSRVSGLRAREIHAHELTFLTAVDWNVHVTRATWDKWQDMILEADPSSLCEFVRESLSPEGLSNATPESSSNITTESSSNATP
ncbi:PHO85 cyclin-5 [Kalmusia sp. IMI 367209]|nr:PHO85 cyclin-5 [Kalmusia sp. IMI 367209]